MSFHNKPNYQIPELIEALKAHRLPHDTPSQLADSFRIGWMACRELAQADSVQEDAAWMPLTPELLTAIESGDLGNRFWIAAHNNNEPQIGVYEWWQGRNPHGFNSDLSRYGASEITHVLPYKPPALPAARKQDDALIRNFVDAIKLDRHDWEDWPEDSRKAFEALRAAQEDKSHDN